jgi:hypothetical protein
MIRSLFFTFLIVVGTVSVSAQNLTLSGTVSEEDSREPAVAASIELLTPRDSVYIKGGVTNDYGKFQLQELSAGNYILKITYLGYIPVFKNVSLSKERENTNVGQILLKPDEIFLKEAVVEGKVPEVVVKGDTIEYDAKSYKTPENAVLEDLIKRIPGAEVDDEGNVKIGGKTVTQFMVDGKDFFKDDPQVASKNLPADMVEKLKVFNRKTEQAQMTGFDDGEEETVIDLTTRGGRGINGTMINATLGAGKDIERDNDTRFLGSAFANYNAGSDRYTLILNTNNTNNMGGMNIMGGGTGGGGGGFRGGSGLTTVKNLMFGFNKEFSKKLTINGDARFNGQDNHSESSSETSTISDVQSQLDKSSTFGDRSGMNFSANLRVEWKPDENNTLIFRPTVQVRDNDSYSDQKTDRFDYNTMDTIFRTSTLSESKTKSFTLGGNLDYAHRFAKAGRVFSLSARGSVSDSWSQGKSFWESQNYLNNTFDNTSMRNQRTENDNNSYSYRANFSWVEPLSEKWLLQINYRIAQSKTDGINSTYDINPTDRSIFDMTFANLTDTAVLNPSQSRSTRRTSTEQRIGVNIKLRETKKYDLTLGFNVDPSNSVNETLQPTIGNVKNNFISHSYSDRLANIMGDSVISSIPQNVVNFSPVINFKYDFSERTNLRFNYEGETNQPSANQLRDYLDERDPINLTQGNPSLKPGYQNQMRLEFSKYVPETQLMYRFDLSGNFSFNDIAEVTKMLDQGRRLTTYENINGNWSANAGGMFNTPLKNKRFTVANFAMVAIGETNSYVDDKLNTGSSTMVMTRPMINFKTLSDENSKTSLFLGINGSFGYNNIVYTLNTQNNQRTYNYGAGAFFTLELPYSWVIDSNINWSKTEGLSADYTVPQTLWNASITKNNILNGKFGTGGLKLEFFDILKNRRSISSSSTTNGFTASQSLVIPSYFMASFVYSFKNFQMQGGDRMFGPGFQGRPPGEGGGRMRMARPSGGRGMF